MAPEVWRREISVHSDQYSFAATWYEMRTGARVFPGTSIPEVALQHMSGVPEVSKVPEAEQKVLLRALAKEPDQRFPSCADFVQGLREVIEPQPKEEVPAKRWLTGPRLVVALGLVLVAVVVARYVRDHTTAGSADGDGTTVKKTTWLPDKWAPASPTESIVEDRNHHRYFRQISRAFGGETVTMVVVPQETPTDPPTFYMMRDKVWNDLFRAYRSDPKSQTLRRKYASRAGCERLEKAGETDWEKGAHGGGGIQTPMRDFGAVSKDRGRIPVYRVTPFEAACVAEWMDGRLPSQMQYQRAVGIEKESLPRVFDINADPTSLPLNPPDGPWSIDKWGRDEIGEGCRQLVSNGREYTRNLSDKPGDLPLTDMKLLSAVHVVGRSYLDTTPPNPGEVVKHRSEFVDATPFECSFRVVLEE
jgi:hypothetical protein